MRSLKTNDRAFCRWTQITIQKSSAFPYSYDLEPQIKTDERS
ncbi:hypothetical protein [Nostoc sp. FACHB-133]|nr:hypothetical protein [Nostoc sp. FACHB-133]